MDTYVCSEARHTNQFKIPLTQKKSNFKSRFRGLLIYTIVGGPFWPVEGKFRQTFRSIQKLSQNSCEIYETSFRSRTAWITFRHPHWHQPRNKSNGSRTLGNQYFSQVESDGSSVKVCKEIHVSSMIHLNMMIKHEVFQISLDLHV